MNLRLAIIIATVGFGSAIVVTLSGDHMGNDASILLSTAFAGAALTGLVGVFVLRSLRSRSLRVQAVAVAVIAVLGTAVGIAASGTAMFVSSHDLEALAVVLLTSGTAAVLVALYLGSRIGNADRDLEGLIDAIGDGDVLTVGDRPVAHELRQLGERLAETRPGWRSPAGASGRSRRVGENWWHGSPTTSGRRSPAFGPSSRRSRTASSTTQRPSGATTGRCATNRTSSPRSSTTSSS